MLFDREKIIGIVKRLPIYAFLLWAIAIGYIYFFQENLLFFPEKLDKEQKFNLPYTSEIYIQVKEAKLHALYLKHPESQSKGIVLFLHGNGGNLLSWFIHPEFWLRTQYDVLMIDYRGYGKSTGKIQSENQLHEDVLAAWNSIATNYANKKRVIYGRSLGTGLAAHLATEVNPDLVVLVSAYQSMQEMAHDYYPWVPSFVLRYPLRTDLDLTHIKSPILLLHGTEDPLILIQHSRYLLTLNPGATLIEIPGAHHNDIHEFPLYLDSLADALQQL